MRRNNTLRTSVALAAATVLLGACSESGADDDSKAEQAPSSRTTAASSPTPTESSPAEKAVLPDGVEALPPPDTGDATSLDAGRYRVPLGDTLAFDIDVAEGTTAHDNGLFLSTGPVVIKTEVAGEEYGVPQDPCTQVIDPVGPTVDDLVTALGDLAPYEVTRPVPVSLDGAQGSYLEARIPRTYDASQCDGEEVTLPGSPDTAVGGPPPYMGRWWVLDVDGERVVIQQNCWGCTRGELAHSPSAPESITFTSAD